MHIPTINARELSHTNGYNSVSSKSNTQLFMWKCTGVRNIKHLFRSQSCTNENLGCDLAQDFHPKFQSFTDISSVSNQAFMIITLDTNNVLEWRLRFKDNKN